MVYTLWLCTSFILPLAIGYHYWRKNEFFSSFMLGVFCFFITQWILRPIFLYVVGIIYPPMLNLKLSKFDTIGVVFIAALSAGIFEEIGRYVIWKKKRNFPPSYQDAMAFGLGHASLEAVAGLGITILISIKEFHTMQFDLTSLRLILDRPIALGVHCALTIIVFYGIYKGKKEWFFVLLAVMLHFIMNFISGIIIWGTEHSFSWASPETKFLMPFFYLVIVFIIFFYFRKLYCSKKE